MTKRLLKLNRTIVDETEMRDIVNIFPSVKGSFIKRKNKDWFDYKESEIELTIDDIDKLNIMGFKVSVDWGIVTIFWNKY